MSGPGHHSMPGATALREGAASPDALADHRFAWRWLIPVDGAASLHAVGLSQADAAYLARELALPLAGHSSSDASVCVVDADAAEPPGARQDAVARAQVVCVFGRGSSVERWRRVVSRHGGLVRPYALLPAGAPRLVVPLGSAAHVDLALVMHRPGRLLARLAVDVARRLAQLGMTRPLRRSMLLIAARGAVTPLGARRCALSRHLPGSERGDHALYIGSPGEERKTVVLPLGDGAPEAIVKIAATPPAVASLRREVETVRALGGTALAPYLPGCLAVQEGRELFAVYQRYRARRWVPSFVVSEAAVDFLAGLSAVRRGQHDLGGEVDRVGRLGSAAAPGWPRLAAALRARAAAGVVLWRHQSHGDFAPWNCAWTRSGLVVYDWEAAMEEDIAFSDAFHFHLAPARLIGTRRRPEALVRSGLAFAGRVAAAAGLSRIDLPAHLACWLMVRLAAQPDPFHAALLEVLSSMMTPGGPLAAARVERAT